MKLQHIAIIFAIIVIPITLILSAYIGTQIDTASLQQSYNTKLMDATHDAVVAFELNTANNIYSGNADSIRRDIGAAINTFTTTLATNLGMSGNNAEALMPYIPAILITLYDGYYIYSPSEYSYKTKEKNDKEELVDTIKTGYTHILKPYIYYSKKYEDSDGDYIIVNYTLDNYITLYGKIGNEVISKSGYLSTSNNRNAISNNYETLSETIKYKYEEQDKNENGELKYDAQGNPVMVTKIRQKNFPFVYKNSQKVYYITGVPNKNNGWYTLSDLTLNQHEYNNITENDLGHRKELDDSAKKYVEQSNNFMNDITEKKYVGSNGAYKTISSIVVNVDKKPILDPKTKIDNIVNDFENPESLFNQHKREVIRNSIQDNMNNAMAIYNENANSLGTSSYFSMPKLSETDWEKIITNVNIVTFMQGLVVGTKTYNDYAIITSTNNKQYVDPDTIYFVDNRKDNAIDPPKDNSYHTLEHITNDQDLKQRQNNYIGYKYGDFKKVKYEYINQNKEEVTKYYYRRQEYACYDCIVSTNKINETATRYEILERSENETLKKKYYTALARERFNLDKPTKILLDFE